MTSRKFYRRVVTLEFISEEEHPGAWEISDAIYDAREGDSSMQELSDKTEIVDGKKAAEILMEQGSEPGFFQLTKDGEDVE
jgi:hypothetical protein